MVTRTITNEGAPITSADGTPIHGAVISFRPVTVTFQPTDFFTNDGERISADPVSVTTDTAGEFSIDLPTTDQTTDNVYWLCSVRHTTPGPLSFKNFPGKLNAGETAATFVDFRRGNT